MTIAGDDFSTSENTVLFELPCLLRFVDGRLMFFDDNGSNNEASSSLSRNSKTSLCWCRFLREDESDVPLIFVLPGEVVF